MTMRLLLLGGSGQVGSEFRALDHLKDVVVAAPDLDELDLRKPDAIANAIAACPWHAVVNAAAYTNVDRAESERDLAFAINAKAAATLATETARHGIPLIHISTDYVFDGRKGAPYVETDATVPLNVYGHSKLAGEQAVAAANPRHVILRTSWVYSPHGHNFVRTILRLARERERLTVVDDQRGCPTAARDVARACRDIALLCASGFRSSPEAVPYGLYHFCGKGETTWCGFAKAIVEMASTHLSRVPEIVPIATADYPTPAIRPRDTQLDCRAITRAFAISPRPWHDSLAETVHQLLPARQMT
jgi:dTDP-4-dehydrorhamnose reductase